MGSQPPSTQSSAPSSASLPHPQAGCASASSLPVEPRLHGLPPPASQHPGPAVCQRSSVHLQVSPLGSSGCRRPGVAALYPHLSDFYSALLNKIGVIVYICERDRRSPVKTSYTAMVSALMQGREKHAQGDSGPSGLADPGDYVGESSAHPCPLSSWRSEGRGANRASFAFPHAARRRVAFSFFGALSRCPSAG